MPMRPQTFLDLSRVDRPISGYISTAQRLLVTKLGPQIPNVS